MNKNAYQSKQIVFSYKRQTCSEVRQNQSITCAGGDEE